MTFSITFIPSSTGLTEQQEIDLAAEQNEEVDAGKEENQNSMPSMTCFSLPAKKNDSKKSFSLNDTEAEDFPMDLVQLTGRRGLIDLTTSSPAKLYFLMEGQNYTCMRGCPIPEPLTPSHLCCSARTPLPRCLPPPQSPWQQCRGSPPRTQQQRRAG